MAITLISGLKQANGGTFPLIDSNDIAGGLYTVDTIEEMNSIPLERIKNGMLCWVDNESKFYQYKDNDWSSDNIALSSDINNLKTYVDVESVKALDYDGFNVVLTQIQKQELENKINNLANIIEIQTIKSRIYQENELNIELNIPERIIALENEILRLENKINNLTNIIGT